MEQSHEGTTTEKKEGTSEFKQFRDQYLKKIKENLDANQQELKRGNTLDNTISVISLFSNALGLLNSSLGSYSRAS
jgi:hypothetical protein